MQSISHDQLEKMMEDGDNLAVVDVLGAEQYKQSHLPGALNVPFGNEFEQEIQQSVGDKSQPVVVYCANKACPASKNAAAKLDELGYQNVYDYEDGKEDWKAAGLPLES